MTEPEERLPAATPADRRRRRWVVLLLVVVLLGQMAAAMVTTAVQQTPTIDEPVYVGTAVTYLHERRVVFNPEHPPLGKLLMAAGLAFASPRLDPAFRGDQGELGRHVLYEAGNDPYRLMFLARLPMIVLTLLFGLVVFAFARDLTGAAGGVLALALYALSPDVITHGSLATLDVPAAGFLLTAVWLTWRARDRPALYLPLAGVALGAALATRMSALPAVPVVMLLALLATPAWRRRVPARARLRGVAAALGVAALAMLVVWLCYLAVDPWLRWQEPAGVPAAHGLRGLLTGLLPLPESYRDGMRVQFAFEDTMFSGFLFGRHYQGSLWYYLPAALLVKTPLGMLVLWLAGAATMLALPRLRTAALYLLPLPLLLLAVAMTGSRDFGTRYAIFMPVFLAVVAAAVVLLRWRWAHVTAGLLTLFVAVSSVRTFPYYLPYSNEAFGGPSRTHLRLHDSNVDWGQDLGRLADRLREKYPGEEVWLVYKGAGVPSAYGIRARNPLGRSPEKVHGLLVVSDSSIAKATGALATLLATSGEPIDEVGHSISIYRRP
ncbi:dolichyl-phosphate-mannose-protein mannosyltransferase [Pseudosporangium ferrugineum]|uniref:Dolichyl-phosphate-mannose-protein mannosyltransferase n=2 Tax=Pseudosporangium ferrugineum TaxID=439699 RepID=A0A2T0SFV4_9ACTN|nr:glycosyltransferase family 39 protein [Pseudosporangium ferrugineum]PRY32292.1 dolichyl-phosphate-mannose-protein mannosyltransferase [Pseudosporangium ferrugineum]